MRYAILGDVHANLEALDAVIDHARSNGVEQFACVGDVVGYGPQPSECIEKLKFIDAKVVAGNHDWAILDKINIEIFNPIARASAIWTRKQLSANDVAWLNDLSLTYEGDDFTVTHGTLHSPEAFFYMQSFYDAARSFEVMNNHLCFCGHSHVPVNFFLAGDEISYDQERHFNVNPEDLTIINVGSVGQPRDGDPMTGYGLYDNETHEFELHRISYNISSVVQKILDCGLPEYNAERLRMGN